MALPQQYIFFCDLVSYDTYLNNYSIFYFCNVITEIGKVFLEATLDETVSSMQNVSLSAKCNVWTRTRSTRI